MRKWTGWSLACAPISIQAPPATAPDMLARSSRQVARAVRGALLREG